MTTTNTRGQNKAKPICLRCEKEPAFTRNGFTSAWCPKCHLEKFGKTHDQMKAKQLPIIKVLSK